jgi:hypothetical protein
MDRTAADWPEPAVAPVATRQELLQAALRRSAERGRQVTRRRLAWRWALYLLGWLLKGVVVPAVLLVAALHAWAPEQLPARLNAALPLGERAGLVAPVPVARVADAPTPMAVASASLTAASAPEPIASAPTVPDPAEPASAAEQTLRLRLDPQERAPRAPAGPTGAVRSTASAPSGAAISQEKP